RELVVARCLASAPLLLEAAPERVVRVVVDGRELEHGAELLLGFGEAAEPEVRDSERLANRRLVGRTALGLLQRDGRLRCHALSEPCPTLLEVVVDLAHRRMPSLTLFQSTGRVKSREVREVLLEQVERGRQIARRADLDRGDPGTGVHRALEGLREL